MNTHSIRWYQSKVDWWLAVVLFVPPLAAAAVIVQAVLDESMVEFVVGVLVAVFVTGLYVGLVFPMRYGIGDGKLTVRFGLCRKQIDLSTITEVYPTRNPLSSPALSLDRLYVQFGAGFFKAIMISPADREGFIQDLAAQSDLHRSGDRLIRQTSRESAA